MSKEEYITMLVEYIAKDVQHKEFLTYKEQDDWKDILLQFANSIEKGGTK